MAHYLPLQVDSSHHHHKPHQKLHSASLLVIAAFLIITAVATIKFAAVTVIDSLNPIERDSIRFVPAKKSNQQTEINTNNSIEGQQTLSPSATPTSSITCPDGSTPDPIWQQAYRNPQLCKGTYEHGIFNLKTLEKSLSLRNITCGSYCIFLPSLDISPPTSSLGWALQQHPSEVAGASPTVCWAEIGSFDDCMANWKDYQNVVDSVENEKISTTELLELSMLPTEKSEKRVSTFECDTILSSQEAGERVCGPQILIIGAMKCGTNSIGKYLELHPDIVLKQGTQKDYDESIYELHYFTHKTLLENKDPLSLDARKMYAQMLPSPLEMESNTKATFDKSPSYLDGQWWEGRTASIAKKLLPHAKIIVSVCNPTERIYSQFWHVIASNLLDELKGIKDFDELVNEILVKETISANVNFTAFDMQKTLTGVFYETGLYATHILDWMREYGRENVLITSLDAMQRDAYAVAKSVVDFVGLDWSKYPAKEVVASQGKVFANAATGYKRNNVPSDAKRKLDKAYEKSIRLLAEITNDAQYLQWISSSL